MIAEMAPLFLAAVFLLAALTKLAHPERARASIVAFGVPRAAGPLTGLLIAAELAIAAALLPGESRLGAAFGAMSLLMILTVAVAANLARGRTPECHCFGPLSRGPVGSRTLARNGLLISLAAYVAAGSHRPGWFAGLALACVATWAVLGPLRSRIAARAAAPAFALADATGRPRTLAELIGRGHPVVLVFSQPGCGACQAILQDLEDLAVASADRLTLARVSQAGGSAAGHVDGGRSGYLTLADPGGAVAAAYGVTATPSAALIAPDGRRAGPLALGAAEIAELISSESAAREQPRLQRRAAIARAGRGAAALGGLPLIAAACGSSRSSSTAASSSTTSGRPAALRIGDTYICHDAYALCTNAPCVPSPHDPDTVICHCEIKTGYSVGLYPCSKRAPHGTRLRSEFSTALVTPTTRAMTCGADVPWANCVDSPCERDPGDPGKARCQCPVVKKGPSFTFGGDCSTDTCGKTVWSGAHTTLGGPKVAAALKRLGQPLVAPKSCPKA